ncbi:proteasome subunit beta [Candidatus Pacearchaeota archaeon CG06_land_8_20_14_3_00_35_12]|nr:MAG: proteasome subunit beta [Candidatus Pacearchaeota archaeon CG06_land_8_20_14_3_00_35_12]
MSEEIKVLKTGTTTVGIVCKDGIVMAADKRASAGEGFIADRRAKKIHKILENIYVTTAGVVSDVQLVIKLTKAELRLKEIRSRTRPTVKEATNLFASIVYQNIRKFSPILGITAFIVGGKDHEGFSLYEVGADGSVSDFKDYVTSGAYGSFIAYGILENEWNPNMTVNEGLKMAVKVINTAIKRDATVGDGIDVVVIDNKGATEMPEVKVNEILKAK